MGVGMKEEEMTKRDRPAIYAVDSTDKAMAAVEEASSTAAAQFIENYELIARRCESPIERLLLAQLYIHAKIIGYPGLHFCMTETPRDEASFDEAAFVYQQVRIDRYRVDFLIHDATLPLELGAPRWMVVECDGHDFHERTKEQARRDKQRDRFFQSKGYRVLRFTGSELYADAEACVDEIVEQLACNEYNRRP